MRAQAPVRARSEADGRAETPPTHSNPGNPRPGKLTSEGGAYMFPQECGRLGNPAALTQGPPGSGSSSGREPSALWLSRSRLCALGWSAVLAAVGSVPPRSAQLSRGAWQLSSPSRQVSPPGPWDGLWGEPTAPKSQCPPVSRKCPPRTPAGLANPQVPVCPGRPGPLPPGLRGGRSGGRSSPPSRPSFLDTVLVILVLSPNPPDKGVP